jgi:molecular chaperone HtpG
MAEKTQKGEQYQFQAEVQRLLNLLASSLYTHKDVFIRELVSNASDALNKMRFETLTKKEYENKDLPLEIRIKSDKENNVVTISDTGIGMTKDDLINNLGTIAKSGSFDFIEKLKNEKNKDAIDIIGQFGVGFYSAFMVAGKITVETKHFEKGSKGYRWISDGSGSFTIEEIEKEKRGTDVIVNLKEDDKEFTDEFTIKNVIKKYSNFISFPIYVGDEQVNTTEALWRKRKQNIKEEEYNEFYKFIANDFQDPMLHMHITAEGTTQFRALLFIPQKNMEIMGLSVVEHGLSLYSNKVLIQQECKHLMPKYLRFVRGVVDSEDIPLNISRETIQDDINIRKIRKVLMNKFFSRLEELAEKDTDKYKEFWNEFGKMLKEGFTQDFEYKERIKKLLRFKSSIAKKDEDIISLQEYVDNMKDNQTEIYYFSGPSLDDIKNSPHLEIFKKKGIPVLYLTDPLDDLVMSHLTEFDGKPIKPADQANLKLTEEEKSKDKKEGEEPSDYDKKFNNLIVKFKSVLGDRIKDVVESNRLTDSPCILVNPDGSMSSHMQKILKAVNKDYKMAPKILEINKDHGLIKNLAETLDAKKNELYVDQAINLLFDSAVILDGYLENPTETVKRINSVLETSSRYYTEK